MSSSQPQQQEQEVDPVLDHDAREAEYLAARRAGSEAILVGRETLEAASRQGEQLQQAERNADETSYQLDKAGRILRGMTWSGWVANLFTKPTTAPDTSSTHSSEEVTPPSVYDDVPPACQAAAQAIQNYHANVKVLTTCMDIEQQTTCHEICDNMYQQAKHQVDQLFQEHAAKEILQDYPELVMKLQKDLATLKQKQDIRKRHLERQIRQSQQAQQYTKEERQALQLGDGDSKNMSSRPVDIGFQTTDSHAQRILQQQDAHLDGMAEQLDELGDIALKLGDVTEQHSSLLEVLDNKSDDILAKSSMVTRRTDRLIQKKAWTPVKPTFHGFVSIQHIPTQKYLSVGTGGEIQLRQNMNYNVCSFGLWKRQGQIFGLQSRFNRKWVGQSILGNLECNANSFGRRQEWEAESNWEETPLLCASAGWGAGSYMMVNPTKQTVNIATAGTVSRKSADMWRIQEVNFD